MTRADDARRFGELFPEVFRFLHSRPDPESRLTPQGQAMLLLLAHAGPVTVTEAAQHFGRAQSVVSGIVEGLVDRGLLERLRDERDRRRTLVWLTPPGQEALDRQHQVLDPERVAGAFAQLSARDARALIERLQDLVEAARRAALRTVDHRETRKTKRRNR